MAVDACNRAMVALKHLTDACFAAEHTDEVSANVLTD